MLVTRHTENLISTVVWKIGGGVKYWLHVHISKSGSEMKELMGKNWQMAFYLSALPIFLKF